MRRLKLLPPRDDRIKPYRPNKKAIGRFLLTMQGLLKYSDSQIAQVFETSQWCVRCTQTGRGDGYATVSIYFADIISPIGLMALKRTDPDRYRKTPFVEPARSRQKTTKLACPYKSIRQPRLPMPLPIRTFLTSKQNPNHIT